MSNKYNFLFKGEFTNLDGDTEIHEVFDAGLRDGATLHRFTNKYNIDELTFEEELSAIYQDDKEKMCYARKIENDMIEDWNKKTGFFKIFFDDE